ncbi:HNH endonuclease [Brevibacillus sp. BC25]|uniref:HNH endonuclease n=1 Tax=Brevibacillus sp. BC25 TaxID=1144308 RepID=UPI000270DD63|nr:restriction endonuclease [Brevibacillus sp. BC25]
METKTCRKCGEAKPLIDMVRNSRRKSGRGTVCKPCETKRNRAQYDSNYHVFKWHRRRAAYYGTGTYLTCTEFTAIRTEPDRECAYCGSREKLCVEHVRPLQHSGPNSRWNVVTACSSCNSRKGARTVIEFYEKSPAFTRERFDALIAHMAQHNGCTTEEMRWLIEGYHAGEMWSKEQRKKRNGGSKTHETASSRARAII